jgi:hypothetical protein
MATQKIVSRWNSDKVLFECELPEGIDNSLKMRHAVEKATESRANLSGANLSGAKLSGANLSDANLSDANLSDANLSRAYLSDANLSGANLSDAYLSDANLSDANLSDANLSDANLSDANLSDANLSGANLSDANLSGANLSDANLSDANLSGAYLSGAYLSLAKWRDGIVINKTPIQVFGLHWIVTILDAHMQIGCELHPLCNWLAFDDARIASMDGREALRFWRTNKDALLSLARANGRTFEVATSAEPIAT